MTEILSPELVVATWPFRTGVVVYDPITRRDVAEWDLSQLADQPDVLHSLAEALNPLRAYRKRAELILESLTGAQDVLKDAFGLAPEEDVEFRPCLSDDVERALGQFAKRYELTIGDLSLARLNKLLERLAEWPAEHHHAFAADWWETFERPGALEGPSKFRTDAGPGGRFYTGLASDPATARALWRREITATPINHFSLWTALRCHWGWRLEFSADQPPVFPIFQQLAALFPGDRRR